MISCIICSRRPDISAELKENIASTIGCEYELIVIDNSKNEYSIYGAYNQGVIKSNGGVICFLHEDLVFHSNSWGRQVETYFNQYPKAGLLGVAGGHYLSSLSHGWWETETQSAHLIQGFVENGEYKTKLENKISYKNAPTKVCAVDGFWLCMPRTMFEQVRWDDIMFKGFHGYDVDMSLQVWNAGYEVHVFWDILIEHKSLGNANVDFRHTYECLWQKWQHLLPMAKGVELADEEIRIRDMIIELQHTIRSKETEIQRIYASPTHRVGKCVLKPLSFLRRLRKR